MRETSGPSSKIVSSINALGLFLFVLCFTSLASATVFYDFKVIAVTGQAGLTGMGDSPSINDDGEVAFVGVLAGGQGVFTGNGVGDPVNIMPAFVSPTRVFGRAVQINKQWQVLARDQVPGSPPSNFIRLWDANQLNTGDVIASGGPAANDYDAVFAFPAVNNNDQVVFSAFGRHLTLAPSSCKGAAECLVTPTGNPIPALEFNEAVLPSPLRPMIADDGRIVVRAGNLATSPIRLYSNDLTDTECPPNAVQQQCYIRIADTLMGFTALGGSPGISDDGVAIAFYGNLNAAAADALNAAGHIVSPGQGIFVSIDEGSVRRRIIKIAGNQVEKTGNGNGICEQNEACVPAAELGFDGIGDSLFFDPVNPNSFDVDTRVGVIHIPLGTSGILDDNFVVSFVATPKAASRTNPQTGKPFTFTSAKGIWTVRIDADRIFSAIRTGPNGVADSTKSGDDNQVIQIGRGVPSPVCVAPGPDQNLDTAAAPGDSVNGQFIVGDTNGICHTQNVVHDDILRIDPSKGGKGIPNSIAISPGPDLVLNSPAVTDDVLVKPMVKPEFLNYHATSPLPVVQIGDVIQTSLGKLSISNFNIFDPIANASAEDNQLPRTERRGDHRVVFWASKDTTQMIVRASHLDSDQDGLLDHWELKGIDIDQDGTADLDLKVMGAEVFKRDLFLQIDWLADKDDGINPLHRHELFPGVREQLEILFANAPATPDGIPAGINLHVDAGPETDYLRVPFSSDSIPPNCGTAACYQLMRTLSTLVSRYPHQLFPAE